jgi:hypothetical protein
MGYTRYWVRTDKPIDADLVCYVCKVLEDCNNKGIAIRNGVGTGNPIVTFEQITFNGDNSLDHDHETFSIDKETGYQFCKTARKPYDYAVRKVLRYAEEHGFVTEVSDDGENEDIVSDEEYN